MAALPLLEESNESPAATRLTLDAYLAAIGEFGAGQRRHYALAAGAWLACAFTTLSMVFVNSRPAWVEAGGAVSHEQLPCNGSSVEYANPEATVRAEWDLVCEREWIGSILNSAFFVAFGIGAAVHGKLSDRLGRRVACLSASAIAAAATLVSTFSPSLAVYAGLRFTAGIGVGGLGISSFVLAAECIGPSWQAWTGVGQAIIYAAGCVLLAPIAYLIPGWRPLTFITGIGPMLWLPIFQSLRESPRWLLAQGRTAEAEAVMRELARRNGADSGGLGLEGPGGSGLEGAGGDRAPPSALAESGQPDSGLDAAPDGEGDVGPGAPPAELGSASSEELSTSDLLRHPLRRRTLCMLYSWLAASMVYYGLSLSSGNLAGSIYVNFALMSAVEIPGCVAGALLCDKVGRRATIGGAYGLGAIACLVCLPLPPYLAMPAALAGKGAVAAAFGSIFVYCAELFPTPLRAAALGLSSSAARVGGVAAPLVVLLSTTSAALPYVVFALTSGLAVGATWLLPETRGRPMPETIADCAAPASAHASLRIPPVEVVERGAV